LSPPPKIPGVVSTDIIFAFTYICIDFLHHIHPPALFPVTSSLPLIPTLMQWFISLQSLEFILLLDLRSIGNDCYWGFYLWMSSSFAFAFFQTISKTSYFFYTIQVFQLFTVFDHFKN
jgi:hypothetical protein